MWQWFTYLFISAYPTLHYVHLHRDLSQLRPGNIFGFLVNTPSRMSVMSVPLPFQGKHWIAIRRIGDTYYDLDSKRREPLVIGRADSDLLTFLTARLNGDVAKAGTELLLVLTAEAARTNSWKHDSDSNLTEQLENS